MKRPTYKTLYEGRLFHYFYAKQDLFFYFDDGIVFE